MIGTSTAIDEPKRLDLYGVPSKGPQSRPRSVREESTPRKPKAELPTESVDIVDEVESETPSPSSLVPPLIAASRHEVPQHTAVAPDDTQVPPFPKAGELQPTSPAEDFPSDELHSVRRLVSATCVGLARFD